MTIRGYTKFNNKLYLAMLLNAVFACAPVTVAAAATVAGTAVNNQADVVYGGGVSAESNSHQFLVQELTDVAVTLVGDNPKLVASPSRQMLLFELEHLGNGEQAYYLEVANQNSDDFDVSDFQIWIDANSNGSFDPVEDTPYDSGTPPLLQPGDSPLVFVFGSIEGALAVGDVADLSLTATAVEFDGVDVSQNRAITGAGDNGTDLVAGNSNAQQTADARVQVNNNAGLTLVKTVEQIDDPQGGSEAVPGAEITYQIRCQFAGEGGLSSVVITDAIPADTDFLTGSLRVDGAAVSDAADADAGFYNDSDSNNPHVEFNLGNVTVPSNDVLLQFTVTIK